MGNIDLTEELFAKGDYPQVIQRLKQVAALPPRQNALLGMAYFRTHQFAEAEMPLLLAMANGDQEATVEYGNWLRNTNQPDTAAQHFEKIIPQLQGELKFRALRWLGVCKYSANPQDAISAIQEARLGYLSIGQPIMAARTSLTLASLYITSGVYDKAKPLIISSIPSLKQDENKRPLVNAYFALLELEVAQGKLGNAHDIIPEIKKLLKGIKQANLDVQFDALKSMITLIEGDYHAFIQQIQPIRNTALEFNEVDVYRFASNNLANHLSRVGEHVKAIRVLGELRNVSPIDNLETRMVTAIITLRRGDISGALSKFSEVREEALRQGNRMDAARALILIAWCHYTLEEFSLAFKYLTKGLEEMATQPNRLQSVALILELRDVEKMLAEARMNPILEPLLHAALDDGAQAASPLADDFYAEPTLLELSVLGSQPKVLLNGIPCDGLLNHSVGILVYLALQPGRTRQEITADLWGDHDPTKTANSFRQCIKDIRKKVSSEIIVMSGPHQQPLYSLSKTVGVFLDSQHVLKLIASNDIPQAVSRYLGEFLARLPETEWLAQHRDELKLSLNKALRASIHEAELAGDHKKVMTIANILLSIDPEDLEIEELRLRKARLIASPVEQARFEAERNRRIN